jgi:hypothetical protein
MSPLTLPFSTQFSSLCSIWCLLNFSVFTFHQIVSSLFLISFSFYLSIVPFPLFISVPHFLIFISLFYLYISIHFSVCFSLFVCNDCNDVVTCPVLSLCHTHTHTRTHTHTHTQAHNNERETKLRVNLITNSVEQFKLLRRQI